MAEISVPAWPIPIHQTKLVMSQAQADRAVRVAPGADTDHRQIGNGQHRSTPVEGGSRASRQRCPARRAAPCAALVSRRRTTRRLRHRAERLASLAGLVDCGGFGAHLVPSPMAAPADRSRRLIRCHLRVRIANLRASSSLRGCVPISGKQLVTADGRAWRPWLTRLRFIVARSPKTMALGRTCLLTRRLDGAVRHRRIDRARVLGAGLRVRADLRRSWMRCTQYEHFSITPRMRTVTLGLYCMPTRPRCAPRATPCSSRGS